MGEEERLGLQAEVWTGLCEAPQGRFELWKAMRGRKVGSGNSLQWLLWTIPHPLQLRPLHHLSPKLGPVRGAENLARLSDSAESHP